MHTDGAWLGRSLVWMWARVSQSVRACVASAMEGTDALLRRAHGLVNGRRLTLVVGPLTGGIICCSMPVAGLNTIEVMRETGTTVMSMPGVPCCSTAKNCWRARRGGYRHRRVYAQIMTDAKERFGSGWLGGSVRAVTIAGWWSSLRARLAAVVDSDPSRAPITDFRELEGKVDAAIVAAPTSAHAEIGCWLLEHGIDVLVEKPMAPDLESADRLHRGATRAKRLALQVGHLERFNPAVTALEARITLPLFFEIHRLSVFSPRSLDVDVILDLMIHDIDIIVSMTGGEPAEVRGAGISILSPKVDIANARLEFPNGCVANLTASRVSTDSAQAWASFSRNNTSRSIMRARNCCYFRSGKTARSPMNRSR